MRITKCRDGNRIKSLYAEIDKLPEGRQLDTEETLKAFHGRDLILRYYLNDNGKLFRPVWHTIFTHFFRDFEQIKISVIDV